MQGTLKQVAYEARTLMMVMESPALEKGLQQLTSNLSELITRKGVLRIPTLKEEELRKCVDKVDMARETPCWWSFVEGRQQQKPQLAATGPIANNAAVSRAARQETDKAPAKPVANTAKLAWSTVTAQSAKKNKAASNISASPVPQAKQIAAPKRKQAPAVLIKVAKTSSYAETVKALRQTSDLNHADLGARVTVMRKTRDGDVLLELAKGEKFQLVATKLTKEIAEKLGEKIDRVAHLGRLRRSR